jgi:hypothetical protein
MCPQGHPLFSLCGRKTGLGLSRFILSASRRRVIAGGSMILFDHMIVFFALYERKKDKREKRKYRSAEGKQAPTA